MYVLSEEGEWVRTTGDGEGGGGGGGTDSRFGRYSQVIGAGDANPISVVHNLGTKDFDAIVRRNSAPFDRVQVKEDRTSDNILVLKLHEVMPANGFRVTIIASVTAGGSSDVIAPTAPTLSFTGKTSTSISLSISGGSDNVGVVAWRWYRNGELLTETLVGVTVLTDSSLLPGNEYTYVVKAVDAAGNASPNSNSVTETTSAPALAVEYRAAGSGVRYTGSAAYDIDAASTITVGDEDDGWLFAMVGVSHGGSFAYTSYDSLTVLSSLDGPLTVASPAGADAGSTGSVHIFGFKNPQPGAHTLTARYQNDQWGNTIEIIPLFYSNVQAISALGVVDAASAGALNVSVPVDGATSKVILAGIFAASPAGFSQTQRGIVGGSVSGNADYLLAGEGSGSGPVVFTTSSVGPHAAIAIELKAAT